tara:strand:+ start:817 stop:1059 length:243 start_codon:yes stop_codon:yes gene_type:complete
MNALLVYMAVFIALLCRQIVRLEEDIISFSTVRSRETKLEIRGRIPRTFLDAILCLVWPYLVCRSLVTIFKNRNMLKGNG